MCRWCKCHPYDPFTSTQMAVELQKATCPSSVDETSTVTLTSSTSAAVFQPRIESIQFLLRMACQMWLPGASFCNLPPTVKDACILNTVHNPNGATVLHVSVQLNDDKAGWGKHRILLRMARLLLAFLFVCFPGDMYPDLLDNRYNNRAELFFWKVVVTKAGCGGASCLVEA